MSGAGAQKILGLGHSHLSALMRAWRARVAEGRTQGRQARFLALNQKSFRPQFETVDGERRLSAQLVRRLGHVLTREAPDAVICVLMGNEYNSMAMVRHPRPYDFDWPESGLPCDPRSERLPLALVRAQVAALAERNALMFWRVIAARADCPVYLLPPPPPNPSEAHILTYPGKFGELAARHGINPAPFRLKLWRLYCAALQQAVAGSATRFLPLPEAIFDAEGFLRETYWSADPTHGNGAYGEVLLAHLEAGVLAGKTTETTDG